RQDTRYGKDWVDTYPRIRRTNHNQFRPGERFQDARRRPSELGAFKPKTGNSWYALAPDKILLKWQLTLTSIHPSGCSVIGHWQHGRVNPHRAVQVHHDTAERLAEMQAAGAFQVQT